MTETERITHEVFTRYANAGYAADCDGTFCFWPPESDGEPVEVPTRISFTWAQLPKEPINAEFRPTWKLWVWIAASSIFTGWLVYHVGRMLL